METLLDSEGIELIKNDGNFFLRYDAGEIVSQMRDLEITSDEADRLMKDPAEAYGIIIGYQNKGEYGVKIR